MKKITILVLLTLVSVGHVYCSIGCMDTSKHGLTQGGYDNKTLHRVECSCPCQKQRHLLRKGKCFKCRHYVKLDAQAFDMNFLYEDASHPLFGRVMPYKYF